MADKSTRSVIWSVRSVRLFVGSTAVLFPITLIVGHLLFVRESPLHTISAYYYSDTMHNAFVGFMVTLGVSLIYYQYDTIDTWISTIAGLSALGVLMFPAAPEQSATVWQERVGVAHSICALICFTALGVIALFLFTRPSPPDAHLRKLLMRQYAGTRWAERLSRLDQRWSQSSGFQFTPLKELDTHKRRFIVFYEACGVTIFICVLLLVALELGWIGSPIPQSVFCVESVAIEAFGWSWILKGWTSRKVRPATGELAIEPTAEPVGQPQSAPQLAPIEQPVAESLARLTAPSLAHPATDGPTSAPTRVRSGSRSGVRSGPSAKKRAT